MQFMQGKELRTVEVIKAQQRIALIVKHSIDSHLIFFKDHTFQHVDAMNSAIIHQGKLDFSPNKYLPSTSTHRAVVMGLQESALYCAVIDLEQDCAVQSREVQGGKPEVTTAYHFYESQKEGETGLFLIRVQQNIQNGISIAVFDFWHGLWCQQMMALSSKFLNYRLINTSVCDDLYREPADLTCHSFALVASGEKLDSLNYSKLKFSLQKEGSQKMLRLKFVITRQLRLKRPMTVVGGMQCSHDKLLIAGNARRESSNAQQVKHGPAMAIINTALVQNNDPQELRILMIEFPGEGQESLLVRRVVGVQGGAMLVVLVLPFNRIGLGRIGLQRQEFLCQSQGKISDNLHFQMSISKDCLYKYELNCQPFFQKIKKAPSKIAYNIIKIYDKTAHYNHLLQSAFPTLDSFFIKDVLALL